MGLAAGAACALAIGGLDPGGGAGIVADLRAFAAAGAFGCAAITLTTVQSTAGMKSVRYASSRDVVSQAEEVLRSQRVCAMKVGALGSRENVRAVGRIVARHADVPTVVDTPMRPTRGRSRLLARGALAAVKDDLLPGATVVTVNLVEAEALIGERIRTLGEVREGARLLGTSGPRAVLIKGGHMTGPLAIDVLAVDGEVIEIRAVRLPIEPTHGTGCTFASLIAGRLAAGLPRRSRVRRDDLVAAIRWAKRVHHAALARTVDVGRGMRAIVFRSNRSPSETLRPYDDR
jgi:hydroxymethylpyrimidine/phosphomethylpyrimidine kinase